MEIETIIERAYRVELRFTHRELDKFLTNFDAMLTSANVVPDQIADLYNSLAEVYGDD